MNALQPLALPRGLYALCDDGVRPQLPLVAKVEALLRGGVRVLQLRLKRTPDRDALQAVREAAARCRAAGCVCLVNDRVDWALAGGADGVHLGDEDLPPEEARAILGPSAVIGVTVRDLQSARAAHAAGASYVGLGPIFPTSTKQVAHAPLGLSMLAEVCRAAPLPVVAISGIGQANIKAVAAAGAHGAAVLSGLYEGDVTAAARALAEAFASA